MARFNRKDLKKKIQLEIKKLMDEDALFMTRDIPGDYDSDVTTFKTSRADDLSALYPFGDDHDDHECADCAEKRRKHSYPYNTDVHTKKHGMHENCGCGGSDHDDESMYVTPIGDFSDLDDTNITPSQAFSAGLVADDQHHKSSSYMARPQLYKIAKYAVELLDMVEENEQLDDWQESKIAQISQMMGSVYHSLDYDEMQHHDNLDIDDLIGMIRSDNI